MKWTKMMATTIAGAVIATGAMSGAVAQTDVKGSSSTQSGVVNKPGAMTINQASGGGKPHAPRTGRQPTKRAPHVSAGTANRAYGAGTHATTSKGIKQTGVRKGPTAQTAARR